MNTSIVIALPKIEDAKKIRTVLNRYGFTVAAVCNSGANALASISELDGGVLLCGYHLQDMYYRDLLDYMPDYFEMLLMASRGVISEAPTSILCVGIASESRRSGKYGKHDRFPRFRKAVGKKIEKSRSAFMEKNRIIFQNARCF